MFKSLRLPRVLGTLLAFVAASCSSDPVSPAAKTPAAPNAIFLLDQLVPVKGLTRDRELAKDLTVSEVIGSRGGTIEIPEAGFQLVVPKNAVKQDTRFQVTAIRGKLVAYEFEPHGTTFRVSLSARQSLSGTNATLLNSMFLRGAYFPDRSLLDVQKATAEVSELIGGLFTPLTKTFAFPIDHFSGYVIAW
jgi:ZU5 domain